MGVDAVFEFGDLLFEEPDLAGESLERGPHLGLDVVVVVAETAGEFELPWEGRRCEVFSQAGGGGHEQRLAVGTVDLDNTHPSGREMAAQPSAPRAGRFDPDSVELATAGQPTV